MPTEQFGCPQCDFMIRSENEDEVIELVQQHATDVHGMSMERNEVQDNLETV